MNLWRAVGLLVAFGVTIVPYTILLITVGVVDAVLFFVVWIVVLLASKLRAPLAYLVSIVGGIVLAFPASLFVYLPEHGGLRFLSPNHVGEYLHDGKTFVMVAIYAGVLCLAAYVLRPPAETLLAPAARAANIKDVAALTNASVSARITRGLRRMVTYQPTAEWLARQIIEAFPWDTAPGFLVRDNDGAYGNIFRRRLHAMGIRDCPTAPHSPWQNGYAERIIGSIRRECLDHVIVFGPKHLRRLLRDYAEYYNNDRTHLSLDKDSPNSRPVESDGAIIARSVLGGLHHRYGRIPVG